jgi:hypothetical protein
MAQLFYAEFVLEVLLHIIKEAGGEGWGVCSTEHLEQKMSLI